jgi:hypothetical protein
MSVLGAVPDRTSAARPLPLNVMNEDGPAEAEGGRSSASTRVKGLAPLACKTHKVDARVLAELSFRDLVPATWLPTPELAPSASAPAGGCT